MRIIYLFVLLLAIAPAPLFALEIEQIDPAMAAKPADTEKVNWHMPYEAPMRLCGFPWFKIDGKYERLPIEGRPEAVTQYKSDGTTFSLPAKECGALILSTSTAGCQVRFRTDSSRLALHAKVRAVNCMYNMTLLGKAGFDAYIKAGEQWRCVGVSRMSVGNPEYTAEMVQCLSREMRDVVIHFPLYTGVYTLAIGLDKDAKLEAPTPFHDERPIVFYGTSITQGGCATRPGMASSNILTRMLDREIINEGFSGSGKGEPEIATMLADIPNAALYILDYVHNVTADVYRASLPKFIDILRERHPDTPILLTSGTPLTGCMDSFTYDYHGVTAMREIAIEECQKRVEAGDKNIYFCDIYEKWMQREFWEDQVDGCHLTDMGFLHFAQDIAPEIKKILGE